jgi:hypothetical protein
MAKKPVSYLAGAVFLGTAIGAVVGLFTTPQGEAARRNVREKSQDAFKQWPGKWEELREKGQGAVRSLPEKLRLNGKRLQAPELPSDAVVEADLEPLDAAPAALKTPLEQSAPASEGPLESQEALDPVPQPRAPGARPGTGQIW